MKERRQKQLDHVVDHQVDKEDVTRVRVEDLRGQEFLFRTIGSKTSDSCAA